MKNLTFLVAILVVGNANCQCLDADDYYRSNLLYNWGKPAQVILDFAGDALKTNKSKITITGEYKAMSDKWTTFLFDFKLTTIKKDADIDVHKMIYPDSIVLIGKESKKKRREVFTYVFKNDPNNIEFLNIRVFDRYEQIGELFTDRNEKKVYIQKMGIDFRAVALYDKDELVIDYVIDLSKSSKSKSVVVGVNGFEQPIKYGAINVKTMEVLLPFEYSSTQVIKNQAGESFIAAMKDTVSALFDSTATDLTGFILPGEVKSIHNDQTIQLIKSSDNNPMIVNFEGDVICEAVGDDFAFGKLIPIKHGFYCVSNSIGTCDGLVTPQGVSMKVERFINLTPQMVIDEVTQALDEDGCYSFDTGEYKNYHKIVNRNGQLYDDTENEFCHGCYYNDGLIAVQNRKTGLFGYMNVDFKLVLPCIYGYSERNPTFSPPHFYKGKAQVFVNGETYYIDLKGNRVNKE